MLDGALPCPRYQSGATRCCVHGDVPMALHAAALSFSTGGAALAHYLEEIRQVPMLGAQEEFMLAKRWREHGDRDAAHSLVTSHLRLAVKLAIGAPGYAFALSHVAPRGQFCLGPAAE